jgi:DNA (cytosine-5)-methyltransferase 1
MPADIQAIRVFEAFAGYGGASFGLKKAGLKHKVVMYSEWDKWAQELFEANHGKTHLFSKSNAGDITLGDINSIPEFDLFTGGFPCQPFSSAGHGLGELDPRGTLFYSILNIVKSHRPQHILLENVKGLTQKKHSRTFHKILKDLRGLGYSIEYAVLNSKDYGIPQNRERLWIYGKLESKIKWGFFESISKQPGLKVFNDFLDPQNNMSVSEKYFLSDNQVNILINKHQMPLLEFPKIPHNRALCLDIYNRKLRKDEISITLTEPHHNSLRVLERVGVHQRQYSNGEIERGFTVRKLTEFEHFRLMGISSNEIKTAGQSYQQLCKRAGNGWDVNLAAKIFTCIFS